MYFWACNIWQWWFYLLLTCFSLLFAVCCCGFTHCWSVCDMPCAMHVPSISQFTHDCSFKVLSFYLFSAFFAEAGMMAPLAVDETATAQPDLDIDTSKSNQELLLMLKQKGKIVNTSGCEGQ